MANKNAISWFEIPAKDLERAQNFYETILGIKILAPKTMISPTFGFMCLIQDTEGKRIAFHSVPQK